ncbi:stimulus-sensing domain-containing protein [Novispirillum sp. DQ9]|uniref:sensor histidine kinase n=1 Tax=Novispirillum sp. DQ9 TaxID=3398612 RepID=UPI003C7CF6EA
MARQARLDDPGREARRSHPQEAAAPPSSAAPSGDTPAPAPVPRPAASRQERTFSPLTGRILAVNLIAPLLLLAGLLYLDQYERALIANELDGLRVQADLVAAAIGEGAVTAEMETFENLRLPVTSHRLQPEISRAMVRRLAELGGVRARLFDPNGLLVADSRRLMGPGGMVQVADLPPPDPVSFVGTLRNAYDWVKRALSLGRSLPRYVERVDQTASDYDEVVEAIEVAVPATAVRQFDRDRKLLSAAVPVQYYKQVVGAVMVSRSDGEIEQSLFEVRLAIIKLFLGTLFVTVLVSFYLAGTIARPIRRLAAAAELVRSGQNRRQVIPDLSRRQDEIGELSVSLRAMTEALRQRMDATERFAADVAHEIKNPLTSLRSAVETIVRLDDPEKQRRLLGIVKDDVARLDRLISDISDASRLDAELSRAESAEVPVRPMLETLADVYALAGQDRAVSFRLDLPDDTQPGGDTLMVRGLEDRLVQVLRNLIGNALSFSPEGGVITLRGRREDAEVVIEVEDQGPGIPPGKERDIFNRFYTERPQGEKFGTHSGLGLSISQQIVEAHRGTIAAGNIGDADGAVRGARFTVRLPAAVKPKGKKG